MTWSAPAAARLSQPRAQRGLVRYEVVDGESRRIQLIKVDLVAALHGDVTANIELQAFDSLTVKEVPEWREQETVVLRGRCAFPAPTPSAAARR